MVAQLSVYLSLLGASLQGQLSYRRSVWLEIVGRFFLVGLELVAVLLLFRQIPDLGGFSRGEVVVLYGIASLSLGLAELLTDGLKEMPQLVRVGTLDGILTRPLSPLLQVLGRQCRPLHLGRAAQGLLALVAGLWMVGWTPSALAVGMLAASVLSTALVFAAVFVMDAATCVFTVQSSEAFNAFTYGGVQLSQYPLTIYPRWLQWVFIAIVPVGATVYFPALVVLGRPDPLGLPAVMPWIAPGLAVAFAAVAGLYWRFALDRYVSTGS